jgi:hypothetical protein
MHAHAHDALFLFLPDLTLHGCTTSSSIALALGPAGSRSAAARAPRLQPPRLSCLPRLQRLRLMTWPARPPRARVPSRAMRARGLSGEGRWMGACPRQGPRQGPRQAPPPPSPGRLTRHEAWLTGAARLQLLLPCVLPACLLLSLFFLHALPHFFICCDGQGTGLCSWPRMPCTCVLAGGGAGHHQRPACRRHVPCLHGCKAQGAGCVCEACGSDTLTFS